jgi:hypothetical protein
MITDPSTILVICASLKSRELAFPSQGGTYLALLATRSSLVAHHVGRASRLPRLRPHPPRPLPQPGMAHLPPPPPSKEVASPEPTFLSSLMGRSGVQQGSRFLRRLDAEMLMGVCVLCMPPEFATAARVRCASSVNGMGALLRSRAK